MKVVFRVLKAAIRGISRGIWAVQSILGSPET